jgi:septal ring factor EnvC (AmiA/AmiB activator)
MNTKSHPRRSRLSRRCCLVLASTGLALLAVNARAEKADGPEAIAGGGVARVLAPAEKIKFLEEELAKESDKRVKFEEQANLRSKENAELLVNLKAAQKEHTGLEAKLAELREHDSQLQRTNDRLREETERVTVSVRFALPIIAGIAIIILALIVWMLMFLRQVAARVHSQKTTSEIHELEGRLIYASETLAAEQKRNQALRQKLSELGFSD